MVSEKDPAQIAVKHRFQNAEYQWTIHAFTFSAEAGSRLQTLERWKVELA